MADAIVNHFKSEVMKGSFDLVNDTIKCALLTSTHTTDIDADEHWDDVSANEVSGTGYTAGGATLANCAVTADNTDDEGVFDAADVTWTTSTITARYACIYKSTGTASTSKIICIFDFVSDKVSSAGSFIITWASEGIVNLG